MFGLSDLLLLLIHLHANVNIAHNSCKTLNLFSDFFINFLGSHADCVEGGKEVMLEKESKEASRCQVACMFRRVICLSF